MNIRQKRQYTLKITTKFYEPIKDGRQKFLIQFDEFDFKVGDILTLQECKYGDRRSPEPTGESIICHVTITSRGCKGLQRGACSHWAGS